MKSPLLLSSFSACRHGSFQRVLPEGNNVCGRFKQRGSTPIRPLHYHSCWRFQYSSMPMPLEYLERMPCDYWNELCVPGVMHSDFDRRSNGSRSKGKGCWRSAGRTRPRRDLYKHICWIILITYHQTLLRMSPDFDLRDTENSFSRALGAQFKARKRGTQWMHLPLFNFMGKPYPIPPNQGYILTDHNCVIIKNDRCKTGPISSPREWT